MYVGVDNDRSHHHPFLRVYVKGRFLERHRQGCEHVDGEVYSA